MKGQTIGYRRVSSVDQNLERQLTEIDLDRVFEDKVSAKTTNRPALIECLDYLREGDTLKVHSIDRLARNLSDLQNLVDSLTERKITVEFVKENLRFSGDSKNPMNRMMLQMMGSFAEFERNLIKERQREGIMNAQKKGKKFGRPRSLNKDQVNEIIFRVKGGESKKVLASEFNCSLQTIYRVLDN